MSNVGTVKKIYVRKTSQYMNGRISVHWRKYYDCLTHEMDHADKEDQLVGLHLY